MSDVFHELSHSLGDEERKALLKRISESLNFRSDVDENIYHKDPGREERKRLIAQDISRLGWFQRLLLWLRQSFSGKTRAVVFTEQKLRSLRRSIGRKVPGQVGFDTQVLYPRFAEGIFELFKTILPLREPFRILWTQRELFEAILTKMIESQLEVTKNRVEDLISTEEMVAIYSEKLTRGAIRAEVVLRLEEYTRGLDGGIFDTLQESILPIYYLKELVMFPYHSLFQLFHYVQPKDPEISEPFFKNASANLAIEQIERFYYAVYVLTKIDEKSEIDGRLIGDLFRSEEGEDVGESLVQSTVQAIKQGRRFYHDVPLSDIIRYFKKDPYYQLIFYMPNMDLKEFYLSVLKIRLITNVDEVFRWYGISILTGRWQISSGRSVISIFSTTGCIPVSTTRRSGCPSLFILGRSIWSTITSSPTTGIRYRKLFISSNGQ